MKQIIYPKTRVVREVCRREPAQTGTGFTTVRDGEEEVFFETLIDMSQLLEMGRCAAANKSGRTKNGPLFVRVLSRRKL